ncbi:MAG TPA: NifB/NifX family molybdenum-iron cluster-binding protein [Balneolales bacterium]|nr:NifB/NifX family molybdenum-iron cluster-binding protein [Balneolales bacterium]
MKIAVAYHNKKNITGHTGRCRRFLIYNIINREISNKELIELSKEQTFHNSHDQATHPLQHVDVLINGGMGMGLFKRLSAMSVKPVITTETDPDKAISLYLAGKLTSSIPEEMGSCHH